MLFVLATLPTGLFQVVQYSSLKAMKSEMNLKGLRDPTSDPKSSGQRAIQFKSLFAFMIARQNANTYVQEKCRVPHGSLDREAGMRSSFDLQEL